MKKAFCVILMAFLLMACAKKEERETPRAKIYITEHRTESGKLCVVADGFRGLAISCFKE